MSKTYTWTEILEDMLQLMLIGACMGLTFAAFLVPVIAVFYVILHFF